MGFGTFLQLGTMLMMGGGHVGRSLLMVPRMLTQEWSEYFGVYHTPGTVIPSYLYNETVAPPYVYSDNNVTVTEVCETGTWDCTCLELGKKCQKKMKGMATATECANNNLEYKAPQTEMWLVIVGGILASMMAFGIGANDSANSWATSIGSGAIRSFHGLIIGGCMEWLGAVLLGYAVSSTIRKGIAPLEDPECWACGYCNSKMGWYAVAMLATLVGAVIFTMLATYTAMPISTTHAVIGGACGATIAATSWSCLNWAWPSGLTGVAASWVISPVASGVIGGLSYPLIVIFAVKRKNPRKHALIAVAACFFLTTFTIIFMICVKSAYTKKWPYLLDLGIAAGGGLVTLLLVAFFVLPKLRKNFPSLQSADDDEGDIELTKGMKDEVDDFDAAESGGGSSTYLDAVKSASKKYGGSALGASTASSLTGSVKERFTKIGAGTSFKEALTAPAEENLEYNFTPDEIKNAKKAAEDNYTPEQKDAVWSFRYLLVYQAALESFAHGANDTANATGAFIAVWNSYRNGIYDCNQEDSSQWIMVIAGFFVALGVNLFGYRVIQTVGTNMTDMNFIRGWCVEFATTTAVAVATIFGMPVSTTHCVVGAVVAVGLVAHGVKGVGWGLVGKIAISWVVTLPFAGAVGALFSWLLAFAVKA